LEPTAKGKFQDASVGMDWPLTHHARDLSDFRHGRVAQVLCDRVYVGPQGHGLRQEVLVRTVLKIAAARG
jgi:hypothetical protein